MKMGARLTKHYFENNFNVPATVGLSEYNLVSSVYVPILGDPILPVEVQEQTKLLKANKCWVPDGLPLEIFKAVPLQ